MKQDDGKTQEQKPNGALTTGWKSHMAWLWIWEKLDTGVGYLYTD